jgi:hypothetical protein
MQAKHRGAKKSFYVKATIQSRQLIIMTARIHLLSGLPSSGSTLLGALLRQNPRFHASMTSPADRSGE